MDNPTFPTKKEFAAWLHSLPPDKEVSPVGYTARSCPLAMYLIEQGHKYVCVLPVRNYSYPAAMNVYPAWRIKDFPIKNEDLIKN